jgi:hypothetical protein
MHLWETARIAPRPFTSTELALLGYEVDWDLTVMTERRFELLALAAYENNRELDCLLVEAKPRRRSQSSAKRPIEVSEPVIYGQMRLGL